MTLVLAMECTEGLVLASDSQVTWRTAGQNTKGPTQKIFSPWVNVAWGASSNFGGVVQDVSRALNEKFASPNTFENRGVDRIKKELGDTVAAVIRGLAQDRFLDFNRQGFPPSSFIFCGWTPVNGGKSFILEISPNLLDTDHAQQGFTAIGSGEIFPYVALANLKHYNLQGKSLDHAKVVAYRIVEDAINVAADGLGPPVQMIEIRKPAAAGQMATSRLFTPEEIKQVGDQVASWKMFEAEMLDTFLVPPPDLEASPDDEVPEAEAAD